MRILISFAALFLSMIFLQLSSGAISSLDALSGLQLGFSSPEIGLLGSAHFVGFFIGCWWSPRLMGRIGHSRTFAVFAASGAIGTIAHPLLQDATAWALLRIMTGLCVAGCYTVLEAWLQSKLTNQTRGRVMSVYRIVDISASSAAQLMIGFLEPASYVSYNILAIICCACLFPLTLSTSTQPATPHAPRLRPLKTLKISPLGSAGVITAGLTASSFRMVGPVYGQEVGLTTSQVGYYMATVLIGGAFAQFPAGWLADRYDRRWILVGLSVFSIITCSAIAVLNSTSLAIIFLGAVLFGVATFPIYSVSSAHANDFSESQDVVELNASLLFLYAIGAISSPLISSALIAAYGPAALFIFIAAAHVFLVILGLGRMLVRPTKADKTHYIYMPRTSFTFARFLKRPKKRK